MSLAFYLIAGVCAVMVWVDLAYGGTGYEPLTISLLCAIVGHLTEDNHAR